MVQQDEIQRNSSLETITRLSIWYSKQKKCHPEFLTFFGSKVLKYYALWVFYLVIGHFSPFQIQPFLDPKMTKVAF